MTQGDRAASWRVGIDIGGTFTDVVAVCGAKGGFRMAKVRTDPTEPLVGLRAALAAVGLDWADVGALIHGTTMVTNALVENRLAPVALVATEGFSDVLDIARASRHALYRLDSLPRPRPDVPPERRFEVAGRIGPQGQEDRALDPASLAGLAERIAASGAGAVAVCLLHSYANPAHERAVRAALGDALPFVSVSHEISPEAREYERTSTTVVNAGVMPAVARYMDRLAQAVPATTRIDLFHSAGGMIAPAQVRARPLALALSGPAAGAAGAAQVARDLGLARAISFDMGGTTTDVCLIRDGMVEIADNRRIAGRPIRQPMAAIETIGAGGGSIVTLSSGGLSVGPESAGADPGPACYGQGGVLPTISDADLVLGYLDPDRLLGGGIRLDPGAARAALAPIAASLGTSIEQTAFGIASVANAVMARALRRVSVDRGIDARDCVLLAFGGAGPMHACGLADEAGMDEIVVPAASGGFSALGCVAARPSHAQQQTLRLPSRTWSEGGFAGTRRALAQQAAQALGNPQAQIEEVALIRYAGQSGTVEVPLAAGATRETIAPLFHAAHRALYGFATGEDWILEALRVTASLPAAMSGLAPPPAAAAARPPMADTTCHFPGHGALRVPRLWRPDIAAEGPPLPGPALVVDDWSTTVVAPGFDVAATAAGHLILTRRGEVRP